MMKRKYLAMLLLVVAIPLAMAAGCQKNSDASQQSLAQKPKTQAKGGAKVDEKVMMENLKEFAEYINQKDLTPTKPAKTRVDLDFISGIFGRTDLFLAEEHPTQGGLRGIVLSNPKTEKKGFYVQAHFQSNSLIGVSAFDPSYGIVYYLPISEYFTVYFVARGITVDGQLRGEKTKPIKLEKGPNIIEDLGVYRDRAMFFYGELKAVTAAPL